MGRGDSNGQMGLSMMVSSETTTSRAKGSTTECMVREGMNGLMAALMRVSMSTISRKAKAPSCGLTEGSSPASGRTESSTVLVFSEQLMEINEQASGERVSACVGSTRLRMLAATWQTESTPFNAVHVLHQWC